MGFLDKDVMDFDSHPDEAVLKAELKRRWSEAVTSIVMRTTPSDVVFQKPSRGGGAQLDYVPGWWFVDQLNALFGGNWSFEIAEQHIDDRQCWVRGKLSIPTAGGIIVKEQFGSSDVKRYSKGPNTGKIIDIGNDLKAAATDSLKKCASHLGLASDIYSGREKLEESAGSKHMRVLYKVGESRGLDMDKVDSWVVDETGKQPSELTELEVLDLMPKLRNFK